MYANVCVTVVSLNAHFLARDVRCDVRCAFWDGKYCKRKPSIQAYVFGHCVR